MRAANQCHGLTWNENSWEQKFTGHFAPGSESSRERFGPGAKTYASIPHRTNETIAFGAMWHTGIGIGIVIGILALYGIKAIDNTIHMD